MLLKVKQLIVENAGWKRNITSKDIYINSDNIVSVSDYVGAKDFLLSEGSEFSNSPYSLIKIGLGNKTEEVIAFGPAESFYSMIRGEAKGRRLLND